MYLQEFVQETITQLVEGLVEAQKKVKGKGCIIIPNEIWTPDATSQPMIFTSPRNKDNSGRYVSMIEFDVAITVDNKEGLDGKLKVKVAGILDVGGGGEMAKTDTTTSRIKFKVPVALPTEHQ